MINLVIWILFILNCEHGVSTFVPVNYFPPDGLEHFKPIINPSSSPEGDHCAEIFEDESYASSSSSRHDNYHEQKYLPLPPPCISAQFINQSFHHALHQYSLSAPIPTNQDLDKHLTSIDQLGLVMLDTSRAVAWHYHLSEEQAFHLLPKVDVSSTDIPRFCPVPIQVPYQRSCKVNNMYRTLSGHCNNIYHPNWGAAFSPFQNFLPPIHPDGLSEPRGSAITGGYHHSSSLPSARLVSQHIHQDSTTRHDHSITTMLIAWGQIIDHDITLTADTQDPVTYNTPECCHNNSPTELHHHCFPIQIPPYDPFYSRYGQGCMNFARSLVGLRSNCRLGTRKAFNRISSFLDGNFIYGSSRASNAALRVGKYGLLKSTAYFKQLGLKELLPLKIHEPNDGCIRKNKNQFCFLAGDIRVNEQLILTVLHTIFMREHNRIAKRLRTINPHWNDEKLFQESRRIVIGIIQHITFNEFLPMILGRDAMEKYGLILETVGNYWDGYNPHLDPTAAEEFVTSAFRFGHSLLPHQIERWSHGHHFIDSQHLHRLLRQPFDLFKPGGMDAFVLGLTNQLAQSMDEGVTDQVTTLLFKEPTKSFGMDLAALNIQRGREHGVPSFASYRQLCHLTPITNNWNDLIGVFRNETIYLYKEIYSSPLDIDLWSGGVSELPGKDSLLGPTFSCLISRQFALLRAGDRFWYEVPNMPSSFTRPQLDEIRTVTLSRLICDNTDHVKTIQLYSMVYPDFVSNPRVTCQGSVIPRINLERWRESGPSTDYHYGNYSNIHNDYDFYDYNEPPFAALHHNNHPRIPSHVVHHGQEVHADLLLLSPPPSSGAVVGTPAATTQQHEASGFVSPAPGLRLPFGYDYYQVDHQNQEYNSHNNNNLNYESGDNNNIYYNNHPFNNNNNDGDHVQQHGNYTEHQLQQANPTTSYNQNHNYIDYPQQQEPLNSNYNDELNHQHHHHHQPPPPTYSTEAADVAAGHNYYGNPYDHSNQEVVGNGPIIKPTLSQPVHFTPVVARPQLQYNQQQNQYPHHEQPQQDPRIHEPPAPAQNHQEYHQPAPVDNANAFEILYQNHGAIQTVSDILTPAEPQHQKSDPASRVAVKVVQEKQMASRRRYHHRHHPPLLRRLPQPFPNSPFPGWDGLFSPNPGYLVRQNFRIAG